MPESARLIVRRFRPGDAPALAAYRSDPDVARYQSWTPPVSADAAAELVSILEAHQRRYGYGGKMVGVPVSVGVGVVGVGVGVVGVGVGVVGVGVGFLE